MMHTQEPHFPLQFLGADMLTSINKWKATDFSRIQGHLLAMEL
jgi:hypothetical protein